MAASLGSPPRHFLHPCTLFADRREHLVSTILGSCVAVCLWDSELRAGGMNHYMLPLWNGKGLPTPKYGNVAIHKLVERLGLVGCDKQRLVAKVFGGAHVLGLAGAHHEVGQRNAELARELLAQQGIRIVASDLGGVQARKLIFHTGTGTVLMGALPTGTVS
jgi:chemotaxis protein CheD